MNQGTEMLKNCGIAALASHVIALLVGTYMILTMETSVTTWRLIVMVYAAVVFTLFGFFSATTINRFPMLSLFGICASAAALIFSLIFIFGSRQGPSEATTRFAGFAMTSSIGVGYINLLLSARKEGAANLNVIISFACATTAVVVVFSAIGVLGMNIVNVGVMKLVTLCVLYSTVSGISVLVICLMNKGDLDGAVQVEPQIQLDPQPNPVSDPLSWK